MEGRAARFQSVQCVIGGKVVEPWEPEETRPELSRTEDALRIALGDADVTDEDND